MNGGDANFSHYFSIIERMHLMVNDIEDKTKTLSILMDLWKQVPELRLGQLIDNAIEFHNNKKPNYGTIVKLSSLNDKRLLDIVDCYVTKLFAGKGIEDIEL